MKAKYQYAVHDFYGCESGCCGTRFILVDENDIAIERKWDFDHYYKEDGESVEYWVKSMSEWDVPVRVDLCKLDCF